LFVKAFGWQTQQYKTVFGLVASDPSKRRCRTCTQRKSSEKEPQCSIIPIVLTDYIREAMRLAHYELMENGRFFATIPGLKGLWAEDATLEACREELQSTLEDWIMIKVRFGDKDFPVLNGIDLNPKPEYAQAD
jgi:predicted RNase H-like HicB family nuclease